MKKVKLLFATAFVFAFSMLSLAQSSGINIGNSYFKFEKGTEEWSEPVTFDLKNKKGDNSIPLQIRIKFKKRVILACHYEVEITNLSKDKKVSMAYGNGYSDYSGKKIWNKAKLKPNGVYVGKILFAANGFKPKGAEDCIKCSWEFEFADVSIK